MIAKIGTTEFVIESYEASRIYHTDNHDLTLHPPYLLITFRDVYPCLCCGIRHEYTLVSSYKKLLKRLTKSKKKIQKQYPSIDFKWEFVYEDGTPYNPQSKKVFDKVIVELRNGRTYWSEICFKTKAVVHTEWGIAHYFNPTQNWDFVKQYKQLCKNLMEDEQEI